MSYIFIYYSEIYSDYIGSLKSKCIKYVQKAKIYQKEKCFYI